MSYVSLRLSTEAQARVRDVVGQLARIAPAGALADVADTSDTDVPDDGGASDGARTRADGQRGLPGEVPADKLHVTLFASERPLYAPTDFPSDTSIVETTESDGARVGESPVAAESTSDAAPAPAPPSAQPALPSDLASLACDCQVTGVQLFQSKKPDPDAPPDPPPPDVIVTLTLAAPALVAAHNRIISDHADLPADRRPVHVYGGYLAHVTVSYGAGASFAAWRAALVAGRGRLVLPSLRVEAPSITEYNASWAP